jgi:hypothetical protein
MARSRAVIDPEQLPDETPDDDPDYDDEPAQGRGLAPRVGDSSDRDWEFKTQTLELAQVTDGKTLAEALTEAAADGWHLATIVDAGDRRVLLLRRPKRPERKQRKVGFAPPGRA